MAEEKKTIESEPLNGNTKKTVTQKPVKKSTSINPKAKSSKAKPTKAKPISRVTKPIRNYPIFTVEKSIIIAQKLKEKNGGNPWTPTDIKTAINMTDNNKFFYCSQASRDFGFTVGTAAAKEVALTEFGRSTVYAPDIQTEKRKKIEAFLKIEIFKDVLEYYKGSKLPEMKYLSNTLEDKFKLHPDLHEEFSKIFNDNCKELNITNGNPLSESEILSKPHSTIIVGETKKNVKGKLKAFVIMPFVERNDKRAQGFFKEVLDSIIIPAGIEAGFNVETANKQGSDVIQSTIINDLLEADLVIADLTDHNPNVLFELGMRMANDLPVALIKTKDTGKIFDVDNMLRVFEYNQNLWKSTIESDIPNLVEHFKAAWDNRGSEQTYMKILRRVSIHPSEITH